MLELPKYISRHRNVSGIPTRNGTSGASSGIRKPDGAIITGHILSWRNLSAADRAVVFAEREHLGIFKKKGE